MKFLKALITIYLFAFYIAGAQQDKKTDHVIIGSSYLPDLKERQDFANTYQNKRSGAQKRYVPIQVHVVSDYWGQRVDNRTLYNSFLSLNTQFEPMDIEFYFNGPINYIDNWQYSELETEQERDQLLAATKVDSVINIYYIEIMGFLEGCGVATYAPSVADGYVIIENVCTGGYTLEHEIGHFFGLLHTHETQFGIELVNGSNCQTAGDQICDTPANPNLADSLDYNCNYLGKAKDPLGQAYQIDPENIMSYSNPWCKRKFTPGQYQRMEQWYQQRGQEFSNHIKHEFLVFLDPDKHIIRQQHVDTVQFELLNFSPLTYAGAMRYQVLLIDAQNKSYIIADSVFQGTLEPFKFNTITQMLKVPASVPLGNYKLKVVIDQDNQVQEVDEFNHPIKDVKLYDPNVLLPDLELMHGLPITKYYYGDEYSLSFNIKNVGNTFAANIKWQIFYSSDSIFDSRDLPMNSGILPTLAAGASQAYGPSTFLPKDTSKPHFLFIVADPQLTIDEISEVNNTTMIKVDKFTSRPEDMDPDFVVDSVHTLFSSSEHKKPLDTLHYQVYLGDLNETFPFVTSFTAYLSKDNAISADDNNLGTTFHNYYLAHFNGIDTGFEIPFGTVAGDYHVILKADPEDYVTESDESNNTFSMPIHIYPSDKADVSIMNIQASPQLWQYGQIASVKTLLSNTGFSTANNYKIALYLEQDRTALTGNFSQRLVPYYVSSALNKPIYMGDTASQLLWVGATPDKIAKGSYYLGLCYQDLSGEEYTHNNCAVATHMVTVTETDPTAINDAILSDLVLYPNPVADLLNIEISASIDDITLFDLVGNTVLVQRKRMHQLDLSHLSAGVYQARITLSDGNFAIKMIVKK